MMNKFLILISIMYVSGCSTHVDCIDCHDNSVITHSCPEVGHGPCYLCDAPTIAKK